MAERRRRQTTEFVTNGSVAVDRAFALRQSALPEREDHPQLPEQQRQARPRAVRVRAKLVLSPFAVVGFAMVAVMLFMMISAYVRLYETTTDVAGLNADLSSLQEQKAILTTQYESKIDLSHIEEMATGELGMVKPGGDQTVYVDLAGPDEAKIITPDRSETARTVWQAFSESVSDLLSDLKAYFR